MSQADVELVRRVYERLHHDLATPLTEADIVELFDPEVEVDLTRRVLNPGTYRGHEGMERAREELRQIWSKWVLEPERLIDTGDEVVVVERVLGRARASGIELNDRGATRYLVRDGRIARVVIYFDVAEALADVGVQD
jgi:ketosteroid isomerase-like protein